MNFLFQILSFPHRHSDHHVISQWRVAVSPKHEIKNGTRGSWGRDLMEHMGSNSLMINVSSLHSRLRRR